MLAAVALRTDRRRVLAAAAGQGHGFLPLVLPVAALAWLHLGGAAVAKA